MPPETDEFAAALGLSIKVLRTDRGIERKDLADRAGLSYSHLASIETGQKQPSQTALVAIAEALGLRSHELLASVEERRDRTQRSGGDPWWLTGAKPARSMAMPMTAAAPPLSGSIPPRPDATGDLSSFIREITDLAERLLPRERDTILNVARKLAHQRR